MHLRSGTGQRDDVVVRIGEIVPATIRIFVLGPVALASFVADGCHVFDASSG